MAWASRSLATCGPVAVQDFGRTCFVDYHWLHGHSQKGFWWRPPAGTALAADPLIDWPYWHDEPTPHEGGADFTRPIVYCNGSFWDGLRKAFNGVYQPCGVIEPQGSALVTVTQRRMYCCPSANWAWDWYCDVSGFTGFPCDTLNGRYVVSYNADGLTDDCVWYGYNLADPSSQASFQRTGPSTWQAGVFNPNGASAIYDGIPDSAVTPGAPWSPTAGTGEGGCDLQGPSIVFTPIRHFPLDSCLGEGLVTDAGEPITTDGADQLATD